MTRLFSFILLLSLLPRLALAAPASGMVCFGTDHVATACHSGNTSENCIAPTSGDDGIAETNDGDCIDVHTDPSPVRKEEVSAPVLPLAVPDFDTPLSFALLAPSPARFVEAHSDAPTFCARDFSCSIALRC